MLAGLFYSLNRYVERRKAIRELSSLSDKQLKDIGITRSEINRVV